MDEHRVREILRRNGVKGINKIVIETGKDGKYKSVLLLENPKDRALAEKALGFRD